MATKNWVRLAASPELQDSDGTDGLFSSVDLSAYVDPLRNKGFLITSVKMQLMADSAIKMATGTQTVGTGNLRRWESYVSPVRKLQ